MISFTSERLTFRELRPEDVSETYISWLNDPMINQYLETRFTLQNKVSVCDFVATQLASPDNFLLRVALAEDDCHIGNLKLGPINRHHASSMISPFIGEKALHGRGYAREAIDRVTRWGFESCGLYRLEAGCYDDNFGSLRAFLKAGYTVEGFRRAAVITAGGMRSGAFWFARLASDTVGGE